MVLGEDLGASSGAGVEAALEVGELGLQRVPGYEARCPPAHQLARGISRRVVSAQARLPEHRAAEGAPGAGIEVAEGHREDDQLSDERATRDEKDPRDTVQVAPQRGRPYEREAYQQRDHDRDEQPPQEAGDAAVDESRADKARRARLVRQAVDPRQPCRARVTEPGEHLGDDVLAQRAVERAERIIEGVALVPAPARVYHHGASTDASLHM